MKQTILNLLSAFQKSFRRNYPVFFFFLLTGFSLQNQEKPERSESVRLYTKTNLRREFSKDTVYAVVIKNNKSCLNCFQTVSQFLENINSQFGIKMVASSYSDSTSLSRKRNIYELATMFPDTYEPTVCYSTHWNENTTTPELLIIKNKIIHRFSYETLFANGFDSVAPETRNKIIAILKTE